MARKAALAALALLAVHAVAAEPVVAPIAESEMRPGYGVVESVREVRVLPRSASAAAGGSSASAAEARPMYRVAVRLPDGSLQYRDTDMPEFRPGDNVLLTNAGDILPD